MLAFMFYIWAVLAIYYEFWSLNKDNWRKCVKLRKKLIVKELDKNKVLHTNVTRNELYWLGMNILYTIWGIVGLLTSQWVLFMLVIIIGLIKDIKFLRYSYFYNLIDSFLCICIWTFMLINVYHLHINLFQYILGWFK